MMSEVKFYLRLLLRRSPIMVLLFLICALAGVVIAQRLPNMYTTSATLLVESSQISDDLVRSTVRVDASQQLEVIQQRLLTRANLLDIARDIDVFPEIRTMTPDEIVGGMRKSTRVRRTGGRDRATLMTISFEGRDPVKAAAVVNRYTTIVEELNSDFRTSAAEGTLNFFEQEVRRLSQDLDTKSAEIVAFKSQNADALPENLEYRLGRQALLQERVARAERDIEALQAQRASVKRIYETTGALTTPGTALTPAERELQQLEAQLRSMLSTLSEQNPKVRNLRAQIDSLRATVQAGLTSASSDETQGAAASALDISLSELDTRIAFLRQEVDANQQELTQLNDTIERTPVNSITLSAMERDLANIQSLYSNAIDSLSQAQMGERIELSAQGERISVLEAATVPSRPSSPNRPRVIAAGVGLGLALAGGFFLLMELLNTAIRRPVDIVKGMNITPLATVPRIETIAHKRMRRMAQVATLILVLAGVPALLWAVDTYYLPLDLLFERLKDRLV
ncbi:MAG: lipopolysaccharide biosynthesis [Pseudomonadota bacterium]